MKHYMKWMAAAIVAGAVALVNVKVVLDANRTNDLVETTLETFGQNTGGGQESNNHGSGKFYYEHLIGTPEDCKLYQYRAIDGSMHNTPEEALKIGASYTKITISGAEDLCKEDGNGCTLYTCQQVP